MKVVCGVFNLGFLRKWPLYSFRGKVFYAPQSLLLSEIHWLCLVLIQFCMLSIGRGKSNKLRSEIGHNVTMHCPIFYMFILCFILSYVVISVML